MAVFVQIFRLFRISLARFRHESFGGYRLRPPNHPYPFRHIQMPNQIKGTILRKFTRSTFPRVSPASRAFFVIEYSIQEYMGVQTKSTSGPPNLQSFNVSSSSSNMLKKTSLGTQRCLRWLERRGIGVWWIRQ
jgi:hypothetical protein